MHERLVVRVFEKWGLLGHHTGATIEKGITKGSTHNIHEAKYERKKK